MERKSIFNIRIPEEYRPVCQDITRMLTIQIVTNYLLHLSNPQQNIFLSQDFIKTLLFLLVGISVYWLVFNKIVVFGNTNDNKSGFFYGSN